MKYLKFVSYLYIVLAIAFAVDGFMKLNNNEPAVLSFMFAGLALFMFFFRMRYQKRFQDRSNKQ
jgi:positive regulator of sigma E activity